MMREGVMKKEFVFDCDASHGLCALCTHDRARSIDRPGATGSPYENDEADPHKTGQVGMRSHLSMN